MTTNEDGYPIMTARIMAIAAVLLPVGLAPTIAPAMAQHEATPGETLSPAGEEAGGPRLDPALRALRFDALEDMTVFGAEGEEVGEVDTVILGDDGRLLAAVETQGWLGVRTGVVAIPLDVMTVSGDALVLRELTEEQIEDIMARDATSYGEVSGYATLGEAWDSRLVD
ncbi:MAG TPA: PRC-barrel domain-containing protein [Arenibaculum sp.]|nr:PRC-barrel domain-containing protein [Arenibaculum sp.]